MGEQTAPTVTQSTKTELAPEAKKIYDIAFPMAQQYASTPLQMFSGSGVAGFTPEQIQAQQGLLAAAGPAGTSAGKSMAANDMMLDPSFMLDVANNPYIKAIQDSITTNATDNLMEKVLPGVRSGATQTGGMYSSASSKDAITTGQAIGDTGAGIGDATAKLFFDAYNRGLTGMEGAIGRTGQVQAQQLFAPGVVGAVGDQKQAMEQALLDEQIKKFYTAQQLPLTQAQELMALVAGMPGGTTTSQSTGAVPQANPLMQGGGLMMALLGLI